MQDSPLTWLLLWLYRGLPVGTFHLGSPRTRAVPLLQAATICQQLLASIQIFPLGSCHPQAKALLGRTCFKEIQAGIPGAQSSHSLNPTMRGGDKQSLCPIWPPTLPPLVTWAPVSHLGSQAGVTYQSPNSRRHISSPADAAVETLSPDLS